MQGARSELAEVACADGIHIGMLATLAQFHLDPSCALCALSAAEHVWRSCGVTKHGSLRCGYETLDFIRQHCSCEVRFGHDALPLGITPFRRLKRALGLDTFRLSHSIAWLLSHCDWHARCRLIVQAPGDWDLVRTGHAVIVWLSGFQHNMGPHTHTYMCI